MTWLGILGAVVVGLIALVGLAWANAIRASVSRDRTVDRRLAPVLEAVRNGGSDAKQLVAKSASVPANRNRLYAALRDCGHDDLFPAEYRAVEKVAESDMVYWLMHRNELNAEPTEIEFVRALDVQEASKAGKVFVFRFRVDPPHWAANDGWMAGVAGPFWSDEELPDTARGTFSELEPFEGKSEEEHLEYLRQSMRRRGWVLPA